MRTQERSFKTFVGIMFEDINYLLYFVGFHFVGDNFDQNFRYILHIHSYFQKVLFSSLFAIVIVFCEERYKKQHLFIIGYLAPCCWDQHGFQTCRYPYHIM